MNKELIKELENIVEFFDNIYDNIDDEDLECKIQDLFCNADINVNALEKAIEILKKKVGIIWKD